VSSFRWNQSELPRFTVIICLEPYLIGTH
jgi:hypothetical protein